MKKDDNVIYYSRKSIYGQNEKCQRFTAICKIKDNEDVNKREFLSPILMSKMVHTPLGPPSGVDNSSQKL